MNKCEICGRTLVDAMTLNSTPVDKTMCYREETGNDPRCKRNLTDKQKSFVKKCKKAGLEVDYTYSGRGMFGATCPSVVCKLEEFPGNPHIYSVDNMGLDYVVYCR